MVPELLAPMPGRRVRIPVSIDTIDAVLPIEFRAYQLKQCLSNAREHTASTVPFFWLTYLEVVRCTDHIVDSVVNVCLLWCQAPELRVLFSKQLPVSVIDFPRPNRVDQSYTS